jgi:predicted nucleotidyltransferase
MSSEVVLCGAELADLCRQYGVRRLDLFGSASTGTDTPGQSDLDFLVEFEVPSSATYADNYFGLKDGLERLFDRPVDLVVASAIKNPYFRESVERAKLSVYAAWGAEIPLHGYAGVDDRLVWNIVETKLPTLTREVTQLIAGDFEPASWGCRIVRAATRECAAHAAGGTVTPGVGPTCRS